MDACSSMICFGGRPPLVRRQKVSIGLTYDRRNSPYLSVRVQVVILPWTALRKFASKSLPRGSRGPPLVR